MNLSGLALLAFLPVTIGPLPPSAATMRIVICSDLSSRTIEIPIPSKEPITPDSCPASACHAPCTRKQFDGAQ